MHIVWTTKKEKENAHLFKKMLKSLKTVFINREGREELGKVLIFHIADYFKLLSLPNGFLCFLCRGTIPVRVPEAAWFISAAPQ